MTKRGFIAHNAQKTIERQVDRILSKVHLPVDPSPTPRGTQGGMLLSPEEMAELEELQTSRDALDWARRNR